MHSDGDFNGIFDAIFWGVKGEEMAAKTPRRFEMHPKGGLAINREQVKALAAYVWTISHPDTHPIVSTQVRFLELARAGRLDDALKLFEQARREHPGHLLLGEQAVNTLGYEFMPGRPLLARRSSSSTSSCTPNRGTPTTAWPSLMWSPASESGRSN